MPLFPERDDPYADFYDVREELDDMDRADADMTDAQYEAEARLHLADLEREDRTRICTGCSHTFEVANPFLFDDCYACPECGAGDTITVEMHLNSMLVEN